MVLFEDRKGRYFDKASKKMISACRNYNSFIFLQPVSVKKQIVQWCNGSTADFGSACLGSNPGWTTKGLILLGSRFFCLLWFDY